MSTKQQNIFFHVLSSILDDKCIAGLIILVALLSPFLIQVGSASAATSQIPLSGYCNDPRGHCYAETYWKGYTGGAYTQIDPYGALNCQGCNGFIDNEMWFSDDDSSQCALNPYGGCWVESGISTWPASDPNNCHTGYDSTCLFGQIADQSIMGFGEDITNILCMILVRMG